MKRLFAILILSLILVSCIQYQEKMKLNSDGSGEITFAVGLSESFFNFGGKGGEIENFDEEKIREGFRDKKGIRVIESRTYEKEGDRWVEIKLGFDSINSLMESTKDSTQRSMIGELSLVEDTDGNMVFTRKIFNSASSAENDEKTDAIGTGMMEMMFGQYKWKYELSVPDKIISTNAEPDDIDNAANTIRWSLSMGSLAKARIMTVTFAKAGKGNLTMIILGIMAILFLSGIFYWSVVVRNRRSDS